MKKILMAAAMMLPMIADCMQPELSDSITSAPECSHFFISRQNNVSSCHDISGRQLIFAIPGKSVLSFELTISSGTEVICASCFEDCKSLQGINFGGNSRLSRIEGWAFSNSGLTSIIIPASVEVIDESCFEDCKSLESIIFEEGSKLSKEKRAEFLR
jgi:hypothetical protein